MSNSYEDTVRVILKISASVQEILQRAAELSGASLNEFIVQAALKEAKQITEDERVIFLSERDAEKVFSLIENPPAPSERLKEAAKKHKEFLG